MGHTAILSFQVGSTCDISQILPKTFFIVDVNAHTCGLVLRSAAILGMLVHRYRNVYEVRISCFLFRLAHLLLVSGLCV
jgi:hypothetical protein